jgi:single-strand DNA-binding protein
MNKALLIGNLTKDPELRVTASDIAVCTFTVAVNRRFANQNGEREADFIPVVVWRQQAENCARYLHKGSKVGVCGSIQTRSYEAQDGSKRFVTEVVADEVEFIDKIASSELVKPRAAQDEGVPAYKPSAPAYAQGKLEEVAEDNLPF